VSVKNMANNLFSSIKASYTKKQLLVSFCISIGISLLLVVVASLSLSEGCLSGLMKIRPLSPFDHKYIDYFMVRRYQSKKSMALLSNENASNLVVVNIDEDTLLGMDLKWPIPRSLYAEFLEKMEKAGAKTIGFDLIFPNPSNPEDDKRFAEALGKMDNVFLGEHFYLSSDTPGVEEEKPAGVDYTRRLRVARPYGEIGEALRKNDRYNLGFVSIMSDEMVRSIKLIQNIDDEKHYSFSLVLLAHYLGFPLEEITVSDDCRFLSVGSKQIPMQNYEAIINYFMPVVKTEDTVRKNLTEVIGIYSLVDVLQNMDDQCLEDLFGNKIVLLSATAEAAGDIKQTPIGRMPGVFSHAFLLLSFLTGHYVESAPFVVEILIFLVFGIIGGLVFPRLSPVGGAITAVILGYGYYEFAYQQFANSGIIYFITLPIAVIFLGYISVNIYHHISETRTKENFSKMFREFAPVPIDLVEKFIEECGGSAKTGGKLDHVTVLFSDIRGYTQLSETMSSQEMVDILNEYHRVMGEVFEETGGVIYTYIGDAQLVVYGHQGISKINHAAAAIKAGLMMKEKMKELQKKFMQDKKQVFEIGVGLCTGSLSVAVVGSAQRKQYTVIGDTVNVASRIQGMSRELGDPLLIHERTYLMAKHCIEAERLRPVKLKGKSQPVNIYRAKKVHDIIPYSGDEIKDLDWEVEELHKHLAEEQRIKDEEKKDEVIVRNTSLPSGVRVRTRMGASPQTSENDKKPEIGQQKEAESGKPEGGKSLTQGKTDNE
jgi:adenylate cyclase